MEDSINPFIAYTDVLINFSIVMLLFVTTLLVVGRAGNADVRYMKYMLQLEENVKQSIPEKIAPKLLHYRMRNDPLGTHRWLFTARSGKPLFYPYTYRLTPEGKRAIQLFAKVLQRNKDKWRRIRVEGHVRRSNFGDVFDWNLSAQRAIAVAETITGSTDIGFHQISISGRGSQAPLQEFKPYLPINDRVEIVIEFGQKDAAGKDLSF